MFLWHRVVDRSRMAFFKSKQSPPAAAGPSAGHGAVATVGPGGPWQVGMDGSSHLGRTCVGGRQV